MGAAGKSENSSFSEYRPGLNYLAPSRLECTINRLYNDNEWL
jgi:hypothetical protein